MPKCEIRDNSTGQTIIGYNFGGPEIYKAGTDYVYAPEGGTSVSVSEGLATLNPLGLTTVVKSKWEIISHENMGTSNWRVTVKDANTGETKSGVYPFNLTGKVYELECQPGTWVIASCGGYKIESSWSGQQTNEAFRLKGTGEIIYKFKFSIQSRSVTYPILTSNVLAVVPDIYFNEYPSPLTMIRLHLVASAPLIKNMVISLAGPDSLLPAKGQYISGYLSAKYFYITQSTFDLLAEHAKQVSIPALIKYQDEVIIYNQSLVFFSPGKLLADYTIISYNADLDGNIIRKETDFSCLSYTLAEQTAIAKYFTLVDLSNLPDGYYGE